MVGSSERFGMRVLLCVFCGALVWGNREGMKWGIYLYHGYMGTDEQVIAIAFE